MFVLHCTRPLVQPAACPGTSQRGSRAQPKESDAAPNVTCGPPSSAASLCVSPQNHNACTLHIACAQKRAQNLHWPRGRLRESSGPRTLERLLLTRRCVQFLVEGRQCPPCRPFRRRGLGSARASSECARQQPHRQLRCTAPHHIIPRPLRFPVFPLRCVNFASRRSLLPRGEPGVHHPASQHEAAAGMSRRAGIAVGPPRRCNPSNFWAQAAAR